MKLSILADLPKAAAATQSAAPSTAEEAGAWQREMERAQSEAWFKGALPSGNQGATAASRDGPRGVGRATVDMLPRTGVTREPGVSVSASPATPSVLSPPVETLSLASTAGRQGPLLSSLHAGIPAVNSAPATASTASPAVDPPAVGRSGGGDATRTVATQAPLSAEIHPFSTAAASLAGTTPHTATRQTGAQMPPVRVHIEALGREATVWLGVDGAHRAWLPPVMREIAARLAELGYGPAKWICNGEARAEPAAELVKHAAGESSPALRTTRRSR